MTKVVDEFLHENDILMHAVDEALVTGRLNEATGYAHKLMDRLLTLTKIADTQVFHCGPAPNEADI